MHGAACALGILLKHEGTRAEDRLLQRYAEQGPETSCDADEVLDEVLRNFGEHYWSPRIEKVVESQLSKEGGLVIRAGTLHDRVAMQASTLLKERGSADAQDALWSRLEKWHESSPVRPSVVMSGDDLEYALVRALLEGRSWLPERSMIERLKRLCVYQCKYLNWERAADQVQRIRFSTDQRPAMFQTGYFSEESKELEESLRRFPAGTKFEVVDTLAYDEYGRCRKSDYPEYSGEPEAFLRTQKTGTPK